MPLIVITLLGGKNLRKGCVLLNYDVKYSEVRNIHLFFCKRNFIICMDACFYMYKLTVAIYNMTF